MTNLKPYAENFQNAVLNKNVKSFAPDFSNVSDKNIKSDTFGFQKAVSDKTSTERILLIRNVR